MNAISLLREGTDGWESWSPRGELAARAAVEPAGGREGRAALRLEGGGNPAVYGAWRRRVEGIEGNQNYRFIAYCRSEGVADPRGSVLARLHWFDQDNKRLRSPDHVLPVGLEEKWVRLEHVTVAPEKARSVMIELLLRWSANGRVWFDDVRLHAEPSPRRRVVKAATVFHRPRGTKSAAESVERFCKLVDSAIPKPCDIVCLPEGISVVGTGKSYIEVAESLPGPTTEALGNIARRNRCYIVAGLYERVGSVVYNTAVLIGRDGRLVGSYRKTHLPFEESEAGITPGDAYPVFDTDFGKVGVMICWDLQFPEAARALAMNGAEIILLPIWGGSEVLARARAIENHVFLVSASYDMKTYIVDPSGQVLAEAEKDGSVAAAELHLDRNIFQPWLGDMKARTWIERRADLAGRLGRVDVVLRP